MKGGMILTSIHSMLCGKLLGDGSITQQAGRKPRFAFNHAAKDKEWCFYCYHSLNPYIPLSPPAYKRSMDSRIKKGFSESYYVQSKSNPLITTLRSIWYPDNKKSLPHDYISRHLDALALAWWYQDDGHLKKENEIPRKIILSTESFTHAENQFLINLLYNRFNLHFALDGQNRLLLYDQFQILYFLHLITPYLIPGMHRKIIRLYAIKQSVAASKRTTIYLPALFKLKLPTKEINEQLSILTTLYDEIKRERFYSNVLLNTVEELSTQELKPYQIMIKPGNMELCLIMKSITGLNMSQLSSLCFLMN